MDWTYSQPEFCQRFDRFIRRRKISNISENGWNVNNGLGGADRCTSLLRTVESV